VPEKGSSLLEASWNGTLGHQKKVQNSDWKRAGAGVEKVKERVAISSPDFVLWLSS
jgi:hypothetical protein